MCVYAIAGVSFWLIPQGRYKSIGTNIYTSHMNECQYDQTDTAVTVTSLSAYISATHTYVNGVRQSKMSQDLAACYQTERKKQDREEKEYLPRLHLKIQSKKKGIEQVQ